MVEKNKGIFFQAFLLAAIIFLGGIFFGMFVEESRMSKINEYYLDSEVNMMDILAFNNMIDSLDVSCESLFQTNFELVDRVYFEAKLLEDYTSSNKLIQNSEKFNKKYSILRTYLWIDSIKVKERCNNSFNTIIYIYDGSTKDLTMKAKQKVFSNILGEVKHETGFSVLLIPIDSSFELSSLNALLEKYNPENLPAPLIIVNEEKVFTEVTQANEIFEEIQKNSNQN